MKKRGIITAFFALTVCLVINGQVDYKSKGMSYVANGNYEEAQSQFEAAKAVLQSKKVNQNAPEFIEIEKKISYARQCISLSMQAKQSLANLGEAKLQEAFAQCNNEEDADLVQESLLSTLEKARIALKNIRSKFSNDKVAKANLDKCSEIQNRITDFRENFSEVLAWKQVCENDVIESYESFLADYPNGNYSDEARDKLNEFKEVMAWNETTKDNTLESYMAYLASFPKGTHAEEASKIVNELEDEACWSEMNELGTTESYNTYIAKYPSGAYISYAKQRLAKCIERDYWEAQASKNTVNAFKEYINKYPNGAYVSVAKNGIDKAGEADAWKKAQQTNTIEGYQAYLNTSKRKAYKQEAEAMIVAIKHEQEVTADEALWEKVKNATVPMLFKDYIISDRYKAHEEEARFKYYVLKAREYPMDVANAKEIIYFLDEATKYGILDNTDNNLLKEAQELSAYGKFINFHNKSSAMSYLTSFPQGIHAFEVSNAYSKMLADGMTMNVSENEYHEAISYAISGEAKSYVDKMYRENVSAFKKYQRRLKVEPVHFLLGVEGAITDYPQGTVNIPEDEPNNDLGVVASIGGHSNLFNLELGYNLSGYASVRPRINVVKKKYQGPAGRRTGSDYSVFDLFIAPEFSYFVYSYDPYSIPYTGTSIPKIVISSETSYDPYGNSSYYDYDTYTTKYYPQFDYGVRGGFGLGTMYGTIELFGGYRVKGKYGYVGLSWFFGNK